MSLTVERPVAGGRFPLGETVEFAGTAGAEVVRVELVADGRFLLPAVTLSARSWSIFHRFSRAGGWEITATGYDAAGRRVEEARVSMLVVDCGSLVRIPPVTNPRIQRLLATRDVGPFTVEGLRPAVEALERILSRVREEEPDLYRTLGTAGMLCCRRIRRRPGRPPSTQFSNHSWGTAVDIKIRGVLDPRGDGLTQQGLLPLYPYFHAEGFFWGAGFRGDDEDSMHFEASNELVLRWNEEGELE